MNIKVSGLQIAVVPDCYPVFLGFFGQVRDRSFSGQPWMRGVWPLKLWSNEAECGGKASSVSLMTGSHYFDMFFTTIFWN